MFVGGPNVRKDYHLEEGEEVCVPLHVTEPSDDAPPWFVIALLPAERRHVLESLRAKTGSRYHHQRRRGERRHSAVASTNERLDLSPAREHSSLAQSLRKHRRIRHGTTPYGRRVGLPEVSVHRHLLLASISSRLSRCRYYKDQSEDRLFERWFHTTNLGLQLKPVIQQ